MIDISFIGFDGITRKLERIQREMPDGIEKAMVESMFYVHSQVPRYPPPPQNSSYRRTGTLGRSITTQVRSIGSEVVGSIGTNVVYAPWVISSEAVGGVGPQTTRHKKTGWYTLQTVVERTKKQVEFIFQRMIDRILR